MNKKIIIVSGERGEESAKAIFAVLSRSIDVLQTNGAPCFLKRIMSVFYGAVLVRDNQSKKIKYFLKKCPQPIVVFAGSDSRSHKKKIFKAIPKQGHVVVDRSMLRKINIGSGRNVMTFGTGPTSDLYVTDINKGEETNFKVSYKGSVTPFWIKGKLKNREIYAILSALCVGVILGLNLVEMSGNIRSRDIFTER